MKLSAKDLDQIGQAQVRPYFAIRIEYVDAFEDPRFVESIAMVAQTPDGFWALQPTKFTDAN
jgi:hypothetical protein